MKIIKYNLCTRVNRGTEEAPAWEDILSPVEMGWNASNEAIAQKEAHNGEYTIVDDGRPESDATSTDDVLNAMLGVM